MPPRSNKTRKKKSGRSGGLAFPGTAALTNARGKRLGSRLPFFFKCFHLLSAVTHNSISTLAQAQTGQAGASRDPINAGA
jgi:hypothetical protein